MKQKNNDNLTATLLISCPDQKGLVASVSNFIFQNGGNIIHADQHTDLEKKIFLQRVEWELNGFKIKRDNIEKEFSVIADKFIMDWRLHFSDYVPKIAILVSKSGHCLYDILARQKMGEFRADIPLVIGNHCDLQGIAENFNTDFICIPADSRNKPTSEKLILKKLEEFRIDLVILARYMRILSPDFVKRYPNRIINIHHSFLPSFAGAKPYHQAHERGVKIIGATAHYIIEELDAGPIIEQDVVRISHRDSVEDLVRKGSDLEKIVLARAINLHLRNRVLVYDNKTVVFD